MVRIFYIWRKKKNLNWFTKLFDDVEPFDIIVTDNEILALEEAKRKWIKEDITCVTLTHLTVEDIHHLQYQAKEKQKEQSKLRTSYKNALRRLGKDKIGK